MPSSSLYRSRQVAVLLQVLDVAAEVPHHEHVELVALLSVFVVFLTPDELEPALGVIHDHLADLRVADATGVDLAEDDRDEALVLGSQDAEVEEDPMPDEGDVRIFEQRSHARDAGDAVVDVRPDAVVRRDAYQPRCHAPWLDRVGLGVDGDETHDGLGSRRV